MNNQLKMFEWVPSRNAKIINKNKIQKWRNKLQKYCNKMANEKGDTTGYCVCGYMNYCDFCKGSGETNACVKAITKLCLEKKIKIEFEDFDFEKLLDKLEE